MTKLKPIPQSQPCWKLLQNQVTNTELIQSMWIWETMRLGGIGNGN